MKYASIIRSENYYECRINKQKYPELALVPGKAIHDKIYVRFARWIQLMP